MTPASPGLVKVVHEDLTYLTTHWPKGEVRDDDIRRSSTVLRRLLTYRDVIHVWVTVVGQQDYLVTGDYIEIRDAMGIKGGYKGGIKGTLPNGTTLSKTSPRSKR